VFCLLLFNLKTSYAGRLMAAQPVQPANQLATCCMWLLVYSASYDASRAQVHAADAILYA
jgi:hypothetical protein